MCTTMRKLRRGTARGKALKLFKRRITIQVRDMKNAMALGLVEDCAPIVARISALLKLKRSIKI